MFLRTRTEFSARIREFNDGGWCFTGRPKNWYIKENVEVPVPRHSMFSMIFLNSESAHIFTSFEQKKLTEMTNFVLLIGETDLEQLDEGDNLKDFVGTVPRNAAENRRSRGIIHR